MRLVRLRDEYRLTDPGATRKAAELAMADLSVQAVQPRMRGARPARCAIVITAVIADTAGAVIVLINQRNKAGLSEDTGFWRDQAGYSGIFQSCRLHGSFAALLKYQISQCGGRLPGTVN